MYIKIFEIFAIFNSFEMQNWNYQKGYRPIMSSCLLRLRPQPVGWVPVHYAGAMGRAEQSPGAWPGTCRSTNCDASCGVGTRSPTWTSVADGLCRSRAFLPPQSMTRYSFIFLSQERQLCVSFLPKEIMPELAITVT